MRDVETPPLSAPIQHFRYEVGNRATRAARRRHRLVSGVLAAALLVAGSLSWVAFAAARPAAHRAASGAANSGKTPAGRTPADRFGPVGSDAGQPRANSAAQPDLSAAGTTAATDTIVNPASGTTSTVTLGTEVTVVLPAPNRGHWGDARVVKGKGSVLAFVRQRVDAGGGAQITLKALKTGVGGLEVPSVGNRASPWHSTIVVTRPGVP